MSDLVGQNNTRPNLSCEYFILDNNGHTTITGLGKTRDKSRFVYDRFYYYFNDANTSVNNLR